MAGIAESVSEGASLDLVRAVAGLGVPVPEAGHEVDDGAYQLDLAWPNRRLAVFSRRGRGGRDVWLVAPPAGRCSRRTRTPAGCAECRWSAAGGRDRVQGVPPGLDVDGSIKGKAWDFLTKLSRDADLTGLDLKIPKSAADLVRTARVNVNLRAVLFAVGDTKPPMWLLAAIKPSDDAYPYAAAVALVEAIVAALSSRRGDR